MEGLGATRSALAARGLAFLFGAGGTLVLSTLVLPHDASTDDLGVSVPPTIALVVALALVLAARRVSLSGLQVILALGTVLITGCVVFGGSIASAYALMYVWVSLYAGTFFSPRGAAAQVVLSAIAYAVGLAFATDTPVPVVRWLMAMGTATVAAALTSAVARRVRQQADDLAAVTSVANEPDDPLAAACDRVRASVGADVAALLEGLPDGDGLIVRAVSGTPEAGHLLAADEARQAMETVFREGRPSDVCEAGGRRHTGLVQPVLRDGRPVGLLVFAYERPRRTLSDRARDAARLFAAEASVAIERTERESTARRRRALDINDNVVQGLVLARYALVQGNAAFAAEMVDRTLERAKDFMNDQLEEVTSGRPLRPGDLVRNEAAPIGVSSAS